MSTNTSMYMRILGSAAVAVTFAVVTGCSAHSVNGNKAAVAHTDPSLSAATDSANASASSEPTRTPVDLDTLAVLRRMLPHDELSADQTEPGYGSVKLTDQNGSVLLQVNVQPNAQDLAGDLYPCSSRTPAGYLRPSDRAQCADVTVPAGAHLVELTELEPTSIGPLYYRCADYLSTSGQRVVVSEINSTLNNGAGGPTRQGEILPTSELATIAQSPLWAES